MLANPIPVLIIGSAAHKKWDHLFSRPTATSSSIQPFSSCWWFCKPECCVHLWGLFPNAPYIITKEHIKQISDSFVNVLGNCTGGDKEKADAILARNAVMLVLQDHAIKACATSFNAVGATYNEMMLRKGQVPVGFAIKMFLTVFGAVPLWVILNFVEMMVKHGCFAGVKSRSKDKIRKSVQRYLRDNTLVNRLVQHSVTFTRPLSRRQDTSKMSNIDGWDQSIVHFKSDTLEQDDKNVPSYVIEAEQQLTRELKEGYVKLFNKWKVSEPKDTDRPKRQLRTKVLAKFYMTLADMPYGSKLGQEAFGDNEICFGKNADPAYKHQLYVCTRVATTSVNAEWCPIPCTRFGYRRSALQWGRKLSTFNFDLVQDSQLQQLEGSDFALSM